MIDSIRSRWRSPNLDRILVGFFVAVIVVSSVAQTGAEQGLVSVPALVVVSACFLLILGYWLIAIRPYIEIRGSVLVVRNPFRKSSIPRKEIVAVTPAYFGIEVTLTDGTKRLGFAAQKSMASYGLGRRSRSDDVVDAIRKWCEET